MGLAELFAGAGDWDASGADTILFVVDSFWDGDRTYSACSAPRESASGRQQI